MPPCLSILHHPFAHQAAGVSGLVAVAVGTALLAPQALSALRCAATRLGLRPHDKTSQWLFAGSGDAYFFVAGLAMFACLSSRSACLLWLLQSTVTVRDAPRLGPHVHASVLLTPCAKLRVETVAGCSHRCLCGHVCSSLLPSPSLHPPPPPPHPPKNYYQTT